MDRERPTRDRDYYRDYYAASAYAAHQGMPPSHPEPGSANAADARRDYADYRDRDRADWGTARDGRGASDRDAAGPRDRWASDNSYRDYNKSASGRDRDAFRDRDPRDRSRERTNSRERASGPSGGAVTAADRSPSSSSEPGAISMDTSPDPILPTSRAADRPVSETDRLPPAMSLPSPSISAAQPMTQGSSSTPAAGDVGSGASKSDAPAPSDWVPTRMHAMSSANSVDNASVSASEDADRHDDKFESPRRHSSIDNQSFESSDLFSGSAMVRMSSSALDSGTAGASSDALDQSADGSKRRRPKGFGMGLYMRRQKSDDPKEESTGSVGAGDALSSAAMATSSASGAASSTVADNCGVVTQVTAETVVQITNGAETTITDIVSTVCFIVFAPALQMRFLVYQLLTSASASLADLSQARACLHQGFCNGRSP